ncbi:MAG: HlyD family efflux transporter periplasmic adaptor subunit [Flavobacteriaceae bacterium]
MPSLQEIRSNEVQDILTKTPNWMLVWGNALVLILLVLFFVFSWFIKYPDIITAEAIVTSQQPPQKEYAQITGKLDTLLVSDKEPVKPGEILAMIENTAKLKDVLFLKSILDTMTISKNHFYFPLEQFPLLQLGEISAAYALFESDYTDYSLNKNLSPYTNVAAVNHLSEKELQLQLQNLENQKQIDEKKFELSEKEFNRNQQLYDKGVISLNEFESKKMAYLEKQRALKNLDISLSQVKQTLNEAYKTTKTSQINHEMENTRLYKNVLQSYTKLQEDIKSWELTYLLKSKIEGSVSFINFWNRNQQVNTGELVFTIIPTTSHAFVAEIKAPIKNSGKIKKGQKVNIKLANYPEAEFGTLPAKIVSMTVVPNEAGFYMIKASLKNNLTTSYQIEIPFKNEMQGTAEIITEDLRLTERFFYQLKGIFH